MEKQNATHNDLKTDILKQFQALEDLSLSLSKRIELISYDVGFRYSMKYSHAKKIISDTFIDYTPTHPITQL